jgi:hypothetical protein
VAAEEMARDACSELIGRKLFAPEQLHSVARERSVLISNRTRPQ